MKVWIKNKDYKIKARNDGWFSVFNKDNREIARTKDEASARQAIWIAVGGKEYVDEKDFEEVEDEK